MPRQRINYVQFCDGPADYDPSDAGLIEVARRARLMPGEGGIDLAGLARAIPADAVISVEIPNHALARAARPGGARGAGAAHHAGGRRGGRRARAEPTAPCPAARTGSKTMRIAVIGAGAIGLTHCQAIAGTEGFALAGVADPFDSGAALAARFGAAHYRDHRALIDAERPDGAIVATPNETHVPIALDCLAAGVPVIVEKPLAGSVAEAEELLAAERRTGLPVLVGHHRRHHPVPAAGARRSSRRASSGGSSASARRPA